MTIRDLRGTAFMVPRGWKPADDWTEANSTRVDTPGRVEPRPDPYAMKEKNTDGCATDSKPVEQPVLILSREERQAALKEQRNKTAVRLPSYEQVKDDPVL